MSKIFAIIFSLPRSTYQHTIFASNKKYYNTSILQFENKICKLIDETRRKRFTAIWHLQDIFMLIVNTKKLFCSFSTSIVRVKKDKHTLQSVYITEELIYYRRNAEEYIKTVWGRECLFSMPDIFKKLY